MTLQPTTTNTPLSSGQPSASPSPPQASLAATLMGGAVSLLVTTIVGAAWLTGQIPDWRYALGALIAIAMPTDALRLAKLVLRRGDETPRSS